MHRVIVHSQECRPDAAFCFFVLLPECWGRNMVQHKHKIITKNIKRLNVIHLTWKCPLLFFYQKKPLTGPSFNQESTKSTQELLQHRRYASSEMAPPKHWYLSLFSARGPIIFFYVIFLSQVRRVCTALLCIRKSVTRVPFVLFFPFGARMLVSNHGPKKKKKD